ncbi:MAG TPA: transposase [Halothiobacillaceae bacterium]|nr:transposase [Halothiobacillaceae bacterium]
MENPYWQYFCGEVFFQTRLLCDPSLLTRYRKRLGGAGVEELLAQTVSAVKDLKGQLTDSLKMVLAAAGYNLLWPIYSYARLRGGQLRISLLLGLIDPLLGQSAT